MYPNYIVNVERPAYAIRAWPHAKDWIVRISVRGSRQEQKFYDDAWEAAKACHDAAARLCCLSLLPVPEGLRMVHRLAEYMEEKANG